MNSQENETLENVALFPISDWNGGENATKLRMSKRAPDLKENGGKIDWIYHSKSYTNLKEKQDVREIASFVHSASTPSNMKCFIELLQHVLPCV